MRVLLSLFLLVIVPFSPSYADFSQQPVSPFLDPSGDPLPLPPVSSSDEYPPADPMTCFRIYEAQLGQLLEALFDCKQQSTTQEERDQCDDDFRELKIALINELLLCRFNSQPLTDDQIQNREVPFLPPSCPGSLADLINGGYPGIPQEYCISYFQWALNCIERNHVRCIDAVDFEAPTAEEQLAACDRVRDEHIKELLYHSMMCPLHAPLDTNQYPYHA